jgi:hypothetical protein
MPRCKVARAVKATEQQLISPQSLIKWKFERLSGARALGGIMPKTLVDIELVVPNDAEKPTRAEHATDTLMAHEQKNGKWRLECFRLKCRTESTQSTKMRLTAFLDETELSVSPMSISMDGGTHYEFTFKNVEIENLGSTANLTVRASDGEEKHCSVKLKPIPFVAPIDPKAKK